MTDINNKNQSAEVVSSNPVSGGLGKSVSIKFMGSTLEVSGRGETVEIILNGFDDIKKPIQMSNSMFVDFIYDANKKNRSNAYMVGI